MLIVGQGHKPVLNVPLDSLSLTHTHTHTHTHTRFLSPFSYKAAASPIFSRAIPILLTSLT